MNIKTLRQLGTLHEIIIQWHNEWVDSGYADEKSLKLRLVKKIAKCLEEQNRGKLTTKIPYSLMADFLIANSDRVITTCTKGSQRS